jgi:hypothetical protein
MCCSAAVFLGLLELLEFIGLLGFVGLLSFLGLLDRPGSEVEGKVQVLQKKGVAWRGLFEINDVIEGIPTDL